LGLDRRHHCFASSLQTQFTSMDLTTCTSFEYTQYRLRSCFILAALDHLPQRVQIWAPLKWSITTAANVLRREAFT